MEGRALAIASAGVWRWQRQIAAATGMCTVRWGGLIRRPRFDAVAGWGARPSASAARELARRHHVPFVTAEDGWLRSIHPGGAEPPLSLLVDWGGCHFDAQRPSDAETAISQSAGDYSPERLARARSGIEVLRRRRLSKYNHAPTESHDVATLPTNATVLVVDQTFGDASIAGGMAGAESFAAMLRCALEDHPEATIIVKTHPETSAGSKRGYLTDAAGDRIVRFDSLVNPWTLIERVDTVYVVSSQLGLEALLAGRRVVCFGAPCYSGWGLTEDRVRIERRRARPTVEQLFAALYFDYARYVCPNDGSLISFEAAADWLAKARAQASPKP